MLLIDLLRKSKFLYHPLLNTEINDKIKSALTKRIADENVSDCKLSLIHFDHTPNLINFQGSIQSRLWYSSNYFFLESKQDQRNSFEQVQLVHSIENEAINNLYEANIG